MADKQTPKARVASVLEDPRAEAVAQMYADSLLNTVPAAEMEGTLEEFASFIDDVLERNSDFAALLVSGSVSRDDKINLIDRVIAPVATPLFTNFLRVLARHDRLELLPLILKESRLRHEIRAGKRRVQVKSALPLSEASLQGIRRQLAATLPFEPILETQVDPALLGGLVIRVGDSVYDSSLRTRIRQLRSRLRVRSLNEIQSGRDRFSYSAGN
jgi:F-type H+-transporting ATPase subunit delta